MSELAPRVLIVDQNPARADILETGLRDAGYTDIVTLRDTAHLLRRIVDLNPDVIIIDLENPNRDVLEQMFQVSRSVPRPVAMFVDQSDSATIERAIDAGVATYIVDGLKKERIRSIVDTTVSRFRAFKKLKDELDQARLALDERKLVDRAKGMMMKRLRVDEAAAYDALRRRAMSENRRIGEVAASVIAQFEPSR
jgi:response regulator NasT